jgi:hypothetical protein
MSDREKPLPKPPVASFGRGTRQKRDEEAAPLMADQIAIAQAEGRLEEFLKREFPDNEHAKKLVSMMMGMTGMAQGETLAPPADGPSSGAGSGTHSMRPPEDILNAARAGDVQALMGLLQRERLNLSPEQETAGGADGVPEEPSPQKPSIEKETLDLLVGIADENDLSLDWVILRALRLYVSEYRKTGRL